MAFSAMGSAGIPWEEPFTIIVFQINPKKGKCSTIPILGKNIGICKNPNMFHKLGIYIFSL